MRRSTFITRAGAALLTGCSAATGSRVIPSTNHPRSEAEFLGIALPPSTRAYAITGFDRDPFISASILSIDVTKNAFISRLPLPYTSGLRITMNRGGTSVYASQSPGSIAGRSGGPFPLIHRFSQSTRSIVQTYFLPTNFRYALEQWEIALDSTESCLWIAYGKNGLLLLQIRASSIRHYNVPGTNSPLDVRCVSARGGHSVYVAGRDDVAGGRVVALDAITGGIIRSAPLPNGLRPNYMVISDDGRRLYIGADSASSSVDNSVSHVLVYDVATYTLLKNQSLSTPGNAGAGGMALNPCNGWVVLGYEFFRGAQYLPSENFSDEFDFATPGFDGSGLAFSRNGDRLYLGTGLPAHIGIDRLGTRNAKTEYIRTGLVSGTPDLGNEHIIGITMN